MFDADRFRAALILGFRGNPEGALGELQVLTRQTRDPGETGWVLLYQAVFLGHLHRIAEARERLSKIAEFWGSDAEANARTAVVSALLDEADGNRASALEQMDRILKVNEALWSTPQVKDLYEDIQLHRGRILATQQRWSEALPVLEEGLNFESAKSGEFYVNLGRSHFEMEHWADAEKYLREAISSDLDGGFSCAAHYYLGRLLYRKRGALAEAVQQFRLAEKCADVGAIDPKNIYDALAKSCKHLGLESESRRYQNLARSTRQ
jgi:tetratricopeptide (TPR) repeat protein